MIRQQQASLWAEEQIPRRRTTSNCDTCRIAFAAVDYKFWRHATNDLRGFKLTKITCLSQTSLWKKINFKLYPSTFELFKGSGFHNSSGIIKTRMQLEVEHSLLDKYTPIFIHRTLLERWFLHPWFSWLTPNKAMNDRNNSMAPQN